MAYVPRSRPAVTDDPTGFASPAVRLDSSARESFLMQGRLIQLLAAFAVIAAMATSAGAHHSAANYDLSKEVTIKGTVVEWIWQNPHCILRFDGKDDSGAVRTWLVEAQNPTSMTARGWTRRMFAVGDMVTV